MGTLTDKMVLAAEEKLGKRSGEDVDVWEHLEALM
jgi:hypothetical protein